MPRVPWRERRNRNRRARCDHSGCHRHRAGLSRFCKTHRTGSLFHGHPEGRSIPRTVLKPYTRSARRFIRQHTDHPGIVAALRFLDGLINDDVTFRASGPLTPRIRSFIELRRLRDGGVTAEEALYWLAGVWLYSTKNPRALPDDSRLTFALANVLFKLRPFASVSVWINGEPKRHTKAIPSSARRYLGNLLRERLGLLLANLCRGIDAELDAKATAAARERDALRSPFPCLPAA